MDILILMLCVVRATSSSVAKVIILSSRTCPSRYLNIHAASWITFFPQLWSSQSQLQFLCKIWWFTDRKKRVFSFMSDPSMGFPPEMFSIADSWLDVATSTTGGPRINSADESLHLVFYLRVVIQGGPLNCALETRMGGQWFAQGWIEQLTKDLADKDNSNAFPSCAIVDSRNETPCTELITEKFLCPENPLSPGSAFVWTRRGPLCVSSTSFHYSHLI